MAKTIKNTSKKKELKDEAVATPLDDKKTEDTLKTEIKETITDNTDEPSEDVVKDEVKEEIVDGKDVEETIVDDNAVKDSDAETSQTDVTEVPNESKEEKPTPRWMRDVYGYNWMGQCYDE